MLEINELFCYYQYTLITNTLEVKYELNKLIYDEFGRPNGVMLFDKKPGISAHDLVDMVRKKLNFSKVGHAGALDSFSSGLMIILVGKATKLSDRLMIMEKAYRATLILGIATETQDIEGKIVASSPVKIFKDQIIKAIESFIGGYDQYVSIFSSVKVNGKKLRKVLRDKRYIYKIEFDAENRKQIVLFNHELKEIDRIQVPKRFIDIKKINIHEISEVNSTGLQYYDTDKLNSIKHSLIQVVFDIDCTKGTYIRQLAEDIGDKLNVPASLAALRRTTIGTLSEKDIIESKFWDA